MVDGKDLRPDPRFRRSMLWTPPGAALPPEPAGRGLMSLECPKCRLRFKAPREYAMAICRADSPPYVGEGRGCGWMLALEPLAGKPDQGFAFATVDMKLNPETGRHDPKLYAKGFYMIIENWTTRGLAEITKSGEHIIGLQMPSVD
jgi:hypothetical protein